MFNDDQDEKKRKTILQYDAQGFIISPKQARDQLVDEVSNIKKILEESRKELIRALRDRDAHENESALARDLRLAQIKPIIIDSLESYIQALVPPEEQHKIKLPERKPGIVQNAVVSDSLENPVGGSSSSSGKRAASESQSNSVIDVEPASATAAVHRERDDKGRYTGSKDSSRWDDIAKSIVSAAKNVSVDVKGTDPTVDAISEVATALSPVKRAAGFMLRPLTGLMKSRKRNEPLPKEQTDHNRKQIKILQKIADNNSGSGILGSLIRMLPMALGAIAGIGGVIAAGFTAAAPVIAAAIGGAIALWAAGKGKEILDNLVDRSRPVEQGDMNPDGSSNKGVVGWANRKAKGFMNGVRGTANSAIGAVTGNYEVFDDGTGEYSKNRVGLKTDAINQDGKYLYQQQYGGKGVNDSGKKVPQFGDAARQIEAEERIKASVAHKSKNFTPEKAVKIAEVANRIGVDPNDLAAIISFETSGTFSPKAKNPKSSATGLIQFMGKGASKKGNFNDGKYYGMTRDQFSALSFDEQMSYVEKYYKDRGFDGKTKRSVADAYTAVTGYGYKKGSEEYRLNKVWDSNNDGYIDKGEMVQNTKFKDHQRKYFDNSAADKATVNHNSETPVAKSAITNQAETIIQKAKPAVSMLSTKPAFSPVHSYVSPGTSYKPPKLETKIEPSKEYLTSPDPQKVHVVNSGGGNISQNVSNRILAHAITGGLGQDRWKG